MSAGRAPVCTDTCPLYLHFETLKVQHVFFDGHIMKDNAYCVDVRDVVNGDPVKYTDVEASEATSLCGILPR